MAPSPKKATRVFVSTPRHSPGREAGLAGRNEGGVRGVVRLMEAATQAQPGTLADRVNAALARVRPFIEADGGDVWLIKIEEGVAFVQMLGACGGCPASNQTLKLMIERAVVEQCPEIQRVEQV